MIDGWDCVPEGSRLKNQWLNFKTFHDNSRHPCFKIYLIKNFIAKDLNDWWYKNTDLENNVQEHWQAERKQNQVDKVHKNRKLFKDKNRIMKYWKQEIHLGR